MASSISPGGSSSLALKVQPCCAMHVRLHTAQVKEEDVAVHQGNPNRRLKAELNLFRWQNKVWWKSASWVLLYIPQNQEILRYVSF